MAFPTRLGAVSDPYARHPGGRHEGVFRRGNIGFRRGITVVRCTGRSKRGPAGAQLEEQS